VLHQLPSRQLGGSTSSRRFYLQQYISRVHPPIPFFTNYGYHPRFDSLNLSLAKNLAAQDLVTRLLEIHKDMKARLVEAQERQKRNVDKSWKQNPNISVGDKVWLLRRNLKIRRPSDKFDYHRLGPFRMNKQVNEVAYKLDLPSSKKIHPVFHVSLLEPYRELTIPRRLWAPPPPIKINGEEEFEFSKIIDSRINRRRLEYLVHWQGYEVSERTWEPAANLANAPKMTKKFHRQYPTKRVPKIFESNASRSTPTPNQAVTM